MGKEYLSDLKPGELETCKRCNNFCEEQPVFCKALDMARMIGRVPDATTNFKKLIKVAVVGCPNEFNT